MGNLPFYWKVIPDWIKESLYHRFYYPPSQKWSHLYESAPLRYAPGVDVNLKPGEDVMHGHIAFLGYYEKESTERIVRLARQKEGLFVDVGANMGYYSLIWVAQSPEENRALAIEPSPRVLPLLKKNVMRNGFEDNITIVEGAAGRSRKEVEFELGPRGRTGWGGIATEKTIETISVDQYRIDDLVSESIQFLKIDAEGSDDWVIRGGRELIESQDIECILFEHNLERARQLGIGEESPFEFLESNAYEVSGSDRDWWARPVN